MGVTSALQDVTTFIDCIDGPQTPLDEALHRYERVRIVPATLVQLASRAAMVGRREGLMLMMLAFVSLMVAEAS